MAIRLRLYLDVDYVGEGGGAANLAISAANNPGDGSSLLAGVRGNAQSMRLQQGEQVILTGSTLTSTNIQTAVTQAATDLNSQLTANGSALANQIINWSTGQP